MTLLSRDTPRKTVARVAPPGRRRLPGQGTTGRRRHRCVRGGGAQALRWWRPRTTPASSKAERVAMVSFSLLFAGSRVPAPGSGSPPQPHQLGPPLFTREPAALARVDHRLLDPEPQRLDRDAPVLRGRAQRLVPRPRRTDGLGLERHRVRRMRPGPIVDPSCGFTKSPVPTEPGHLLSALRALTPYGPGHGDHPRRREEDTRPRCSTPARCCTCDAVAGSARVQRGPCGSVGGVRVRFGVTFPGSS